MAWDEDTEVYTPPGQKGSRVHGAEQGAGGLSLSHLAFSSVCLLGGHGGKVGINGRAMVKAEDSEGLLKTSQGYCPPVRTGMLPAPGHRSEMQPEGSALAVCTSLPSSLPPFHILFQLSFSTPGSRQGAFFS